MAVIVSILAWLYGFGIGCGCGCIEVVVFAVNPIVESSRVIWLVKSMPKGQHLPRSDTNDQTTLTQHYFLTVQIPGLIYLTTEVGIGIFNQTSGTAEHL